MAKSVVCLGDYCAEPLPHFCVSGSLNVFVNGKSVCRQGGNFTEGKILTEGSSTVFANGFGVGRSGDLASCGFRMTTGSWNVFSG
ncbi:PAAR domain-containing protein [Wolbachia endosymbiont (group E) of Neria commutata]|uniref:PAAR domain-containing protein n=1 Tax=Wolbachia endosymbiont (group E) of Neria commutata TaxID=3066149 RepID=UPI003132E5C7